MEPRYTICSITTKDINFANQVQDLRKKHGITHEEIYRAGVLSFVEKYSSTENKK